MKHAKLGFSVLEMIIGIMISAMLMTASLTIYNQISKGAVTIQRMTHTDTQIMILHNRLVADLQGLIPLWFTKELYEKLKKSEQDKDAKEISTSNKASNQKQNNFLYAQSNNNQFDILTFITTNALQVYGDQPTRTVRVVYTLQPDGDTFKLMRKEENIISENFNLENLKSGKFNQIAHKITKCMIEYGFIETDNKKAGEAKDAQKPFEFKFVSKWGGATESNTEENKTPTLPDILKLTISIQENIDQDPRKFELFCTIPTSHAPTVKSFAQQRQEAKKQQSTPGPQPNPQAAPGPQPNPQAAPGTQQNPQTTGAQHPITPVAPSTEMPTAGVIA